MRLRASLLALATVVAAACSPSSSPTSPTASAPTSSAGVTPSSSTAQPPPPGLETIDHLIFIVQENRSFDHYFGTFPGADGIPIAHGRPTACIPDPALGHCSRPVPRLAAIATTAARTTIRRRHATSTAARWTDS